MRIPVSQTSLHSIRRSERNYIAIFRCTEMVELLAALSGVMVKSVQADSVVLEIRTSLSSGAGLHVNGQAVELMIQFKTDTNSPQLAGAQVSTLVTNVQGSTKAKAGRFSCRQADFIGHLPNMLAWLKMFMANMTID